MSVAAKVAEAGLGGGLKLVLIEWLDSHSGRGWRGIEEMQSAAEPLYCRSVGWLLSDGKDCKVVVPHIGGEKIGDIMLQGCGDLAIPTRAIVKVTPLSVPSSKAASES